MKMKEVITPSAREYEVRGKQTFMTDKEYRSQNAKKGGVIRWSYGSGKRANNGY